jgi:hypothetical protein
MSENTAPTTLTTEQAAAARKAAKAQQEKARRAAIATAKAHLEAHDLLVRLDGTKLVMKDLREDPAAEVVLDSEQRDRAATAKSTHGGLSGKSLSIYVLTGQSSKEQIAAAKLADGAAKKAENQRANVTRSQDPAATEIAQKAKAFAGVKSAFLPKEGRSFLDGFTVTVSSGTSAISVKRGNAQGVEGALEEASLELDDLVKFAKGEELEADAKKAVRTALTGLGKGTVLWGRKLAALIAVRAEDAQKS